MYSELPPLALAATWQPTTASQAPASTTASLTASGAPHTTHVARLDVKVDNTSGVQEVEGLRGDAAGKQCGAHG